MPRRHPKTRHYAALLASGRRRQRREFKRVAAALYGLGKLADMHSYMASRFSQDTSPAAVAYFERMQVAASPWEMMNGTIQHETTKDFNPQDPDFSKLALSMRQLEKLARFVVSKRVKGVQTAFRRRTLNGEDIDGRLYYALESQARYFVGALTVKSRSPDERERKLAVLSPEDWKQVIATLFYFARRDHGADPFSQTMASGVWGETIDMAPRPVAQQAVVSAIRWMERSGVITRPLAEEIGKRFPKLGERLRRPVTSGSSLPEARQSVPH